MEVLAQVFPDPSGPLANFSGDLFDILGCYFPIHFTHVSLMNTSYSNICTYLSYCLFVGGKKLLVYCFSLIPFLLCHKSQVFTSKVPLFI